MILELIRYWPNSDEISERVYVDCPADSPLAWDQAELEIKAAVAEAGVEFFNPVNLNGHSDIYTQALICFSQSFMAEHPEIAHLNGRITVAEGEPSPELSWAISHAARGRRRLDRIISYFLDLGLDVNIIYDKDYGGANYFTDELIRALTGEPDELFADREPDLEDVELEAEYEALMSNAE